MPERTSVPSAPAPSSPAAKPKRRGWFRRILKWGFYLMLVVAAFHRPIFYTVARLALIKVAATQNVKLDVHFAGTIFTNLSVKNVQALPTGAGPSPIEKISIEAVNLQYSLPNLLRHGVGEFLHSFEIKNADLIFSGEPSKNKKDTEQKKSLAETLNTLLGQPALYADIVRIENFNVTVRGEQPVEVKAVNVFFHPWEPGYIRIGQIAVPGIPQWENLAAETSYANRNLFVKELALSPELVIEELNYDASQRAQNKGSMELKARVFGGTFGLAVSGSQLDKKGENLEKSYNTALKIQGAGIDLQAAAAYFKAPKPPVARLGSLKVNFGGEPEKPRTWHGDLAARVEALDFSGTKLDYAQVGAAFDQGTVNLQTVEVAAGKTALTIKGTAKLPETVNDFLGTEADTEIALAAPSLEEATAPLMATPVKGSARGGGTVKLHGKKAAVDFALEAEGIEQAEAGVQGVKLVLKAQKALDLPPGAKPTDGLEGTVNAEVTGLKNGTFTADSAAVAAEVENDRVRLQKAAVVRAENSVSVSGNYRIPVAGEPTPPLEAELAIQAPKLETFGIGMKGIVLAGHLEGGGKVSMANGAYTGNLAITGGDFTYGGFKARKFEATGAVADNVAKIERVALEVDDSAQIAVTGQSGVAAPFEYQGALLVVFRDLKVLKPLLETFGIQEALEGAVDFSVESQGKIQTKEFGGQLKLAVDGAQYGKIGLQEFRLAGLFGPDFAETTQLKVSTGETSFQAGLEWRENRLRIKDIDLKQGTQQALTGYILVPLEPQNPAGPVPYEKRIAANVNAKDLDIQKLLASFGQTVPAEGIINMNLLLGGTVLQPTAHLRVEGRKLRAAAAAKLDPAELDLVAHFSEKQLTLNVEARQKEIQPLTIKGQVPLDMEAVIQKKELDPNLPLDLTVKLPPSSLAFIAKMVPSVRSLEGKAAIDAHVGGTVQKPVFQGDATVKLEYARMKSDGVPAIGGVDIDLGFTETAVTMKRFKGEVGGGTFQMTGGVQFDKITEPVFGLRLKTDEVLVMRNDSITVRIDSDIGVNGPMAGAKVAGTVWVTHSRFFRDIDILPISLPGRPKPQAKPAPKQVASEGIALSLPPPLSGWTFDLAIKTRVDDPFKVQGNLANGAATIDLKFGGTGAAPWLEGTVQIDRLTASLPFSKLEIQRGIVLFSRDAFAQPTLDIVATSQMRDYQISAYITGPATSPEVSLTSEPPLAQQDIVSLLATGTTISELTGSGDVIASRAAVLLFQSLYHKIFKKKDPTEGLPLADRLSVEAGAVDSKTGRQELKASFKLGEPLYLIGDIDVAGQFTGRVKYLLRFK